MPPRPSPPFDLADKLAALSACVERANPVDGTTVLQLLTEDYPDLQLTRQDIRQMLELLDLQRLIALLRESPTSSVLQVLRALLDRYGSVELKNMLDAMG